MEPMSEKSKKRVSEMSTRRLKVLIVEDQDHKRDKLIGTVLKIDKEAVIDHAHSIRGALKVLEKPEEHPFDVVLLDMGLPNFDPNSGGRNPIHSNGGKEILFHLEYNDCSVPVIVVSATDDIKGLREDLKGIYEEQLLGVLQFSHSSDGWRDELINLVKSRVMVGWKPKTATCVFDEEGQGSPELA